MSESSDAEWDDAPTTAAQYLSLCPGTKGQHPMGVRSLQKCLRVKTREVSEIIEETVDFMRGDKDITAGALTDRNDNKWREAKILISEYLRRESSWAKDELLGWGNKVIPNEAIQAMILRITTDARMSLREENNLLVEHTGSPTKPHFGQAPNPISPTKRGRSTLTASPSRYATISPARSFARSPARSIGSGVTSRIGRLEVGDHLPVLHKAPTLRSTNVRFLNGNDELAREVTFRSLCIDGAWEPRSKLITSQHISWDKFRAAAAESLNFDQSEVIAFHGDDKISNAHELEAAVNDHCNGIRTGDAFEVAVTKRNQSARLKLPLTAILTAPLEKTAGSTPVDSGSRLVGHGKEDWPTEPSDDSEDDIRLPGRRGRRGPGGSIDKEVEVGGAGPAPPGPSPTTPKKPSRATRTSRSRTLSPGPSLTTPKKPSRATGTLRSPTLSPGEKDDPPLPPILEGALPDVEDDTGIPEDVDEEEDMATQLLEYATNLINNSNAGLAAALVDEKYWQAAADTFNVPLKRLL
ncbi:hypothetical protein NX059_003728 [Plenodomus lindquistii]|nr:hypothetical protein NX059_003728 [Plenodomus lindquistii]